MISLLMRTFPCKHSNSIALPNAFSWRMLSGLIIPQTELFDIRRQTVLCACTQQFAWIVNQSAASLYKVVLWFGLQTRQMKADSGAESRAAFLLIFRLARLQNREQKRHRAIIPFTMQVSTAISIISPLPIAYRISWRRRVGRRVSSVAYPPSIFPLISPSRDINQYFSTHSIALRGIRLKEECSLILVAESSSPAPFRILKPLKENPSRPQPHFSIGLTMLCAPI